MAKLTSTELVWKQPVVHDIFEAGGLLRKSVRTSGRNTVAVRAEAEAKIICDEIKNRVFDFPKIDLALAKIAGNCTFQPLHERGTKYLTERQIANILASFCAETEIFWDDVNTLRTTVEMETYRRSILGQACWNFKCFLSQQSKKLSRGTGTRGVPGAPKSSYKSSGPKSGLIKSLVGKPGEKTTFPASNTLFVIECDSEKKKKQYVFVDPLSPISEINKIRFGDPSGWSSCKIFFDSLSKAEEAIENIKSGSFHIPVDVLGFRIKRQHPDPNGYFLIATDLGNVYIKASKLNEAIEESLAEKKLETGKRISRFPEINDIDTYYEAMQCYE